MNDYLYGVLGIESSPFYVVISRDNWQALNAVPRYTPSGNSQSTDTQGIGSSLSNTLHPQECTLHRLGAQ